MAGVVDNLVVESQMTGLQERSYIAQTFVAEGDRMQSVEFLLNNLGPTEAEYNVLVTTVKDLPGGEFQPGEVLAEVEGLTKPVDADLSLSMIQVNLKGVELVAGQTYAFILDAHVASNGLDFRIGHGLNDDYNGGFLAALGPSFGRDVDFVNNWIEVTTFDLAFRAVFSDAGETIKGTKNDDTLKGTDNDDTILGKKGKDKLKGKDGYDELIGGKHDDKLIGGNDGDQLIGGKGLDVLKGGAGKDCFFFDFKMTKKSAKKNMDKIKGFDIDEDAIYLQQDKFPSLPLGPYDSGANGLSLKKGKLKYEGIKFVEFKGSKPTSLEDIEIVVYA